MSLTCKANGMNTHYYRTGNRKPPLVLLHGLMTSGECWMPVAEKLEDAFDVIMPDARGHGRSSAPKDDYTYYTLAADVSSFIAKLNLRHPTLVGHSMGGMTAALVASQNPTLLKKLILIDPTFLTPEQQVEVQKSNVLQQHMDILAQPPEDVLEKMQARQTHRPQHLIEKMLRARFQTSIHAFDILSPPYPNYHDLISSLTIPCLLVIGGPNGVVSPQVGATLAKLHSGLELVQIEDASHGIPFDYPNQCAELINNFAKGRSLISHSAKSF